MSKVFEVKNEPNLELVEMFEELLEEAKEGNLLGAIVVGSSVGQESFNCWVIGDKAHVLAILAELVVTEKELIDFRIDTRMKKAGEKYLLE